MVQNFSDISKEIRFWSVLSRIPSAEERELVAFKRRAQVFAAVSMQSSTNCKKPQLHSLQWHHLSKKKAITWSQLANERGNVHVITILKVDAIAEDVNDHLLIHFVHFVEKELSNFFVSHTNHSYFFKLTYKSSSVHFCDSLSKTFPSTSQLPTSVTHPWHQWLRRALCCSHRKRKAHAPFRKFSFNVTPSGDL